MHDKYFIKCIQHTEGKETETNRQDIAGILDGVTIFRFAHMWKNTSSGGVEAYLNNLNHHLLQRNRTRILQMYVSAEDKQLDIEIESVGRGELIWIPSFLRSRCRKELNITQQVWAKVRRLKSQQVNICHDFLLSTLANYQINLAVFHWISEDSPIVLDHLNKRSVPFVVVNHFHNERLGRRYIRRQIVGARAVGGVSNVDVPDFIRSRFTNLSDGVDTDFFHPEKAVSPGNKIKDTLILLPSRITEGKGHLDAVKALCLLLSKGVNTILFFAGIMQSPALMDSLQRTISEEGIQERVIFAGGLSPEELRNWYAASSIVVLPSYSEGLPKVLLEAQAMERPAIAYDVGGVPEVIRHLETGYLVKKGDIEGLTSRIKELIEKPDMRREMGERGRKFVVARFSIESLTIRHEEFYAMYLSKCPTVN